MNGRSSSETKAPTLRERLREQTSGAILDAAEDVFAEKGLANAHMNDIAAKAGVAVGTLYNHFEDRDALLKALLDARRAELLAQLDVVLDAPSGDFRTDLATLVRTMGRFFEEHRRFQVILHRLEFGLHQGTYPNTSACAPEMKRDLYLRMEKLIKRGLKQKVLRPALADYYPYLLMGMLRSIRLYHVDNSLDRALPVDELVQLFIEGAGV